MAMPLAKKIIATLPAALIKVGVFVEQDYAQIATCIDELGLDFAQVHHIESGFKQLKKRMILSLQVSRQADLPNTDILQSYHAILLDALSQSEPTYGGTGRLCNWNLARDLSQHYRLLLAGGLNARNIQHAIQYVRPYAVDVATGVELTPGNKSTTALQQFLEVCHHVK